MKNIKIGAKVQFFFVYLPSKKMKYYLCIAFWLSLLFVGCTPKDRNTPEAVACTKCKFCKSRWIFN